MRVLKIPSPLKSLMETTLVKIDKFLNMFLVLADVTPFVFNPFKKIYLLLVFANVLLFVYGPCFSFVPQIFVYVEIDL